jgi:hypothetical protein
LEEDVFPPYSDGDGGDGLINPTHDLVMSFPMANGYPATAENGYDDQNPYASRDPRLGMYIVTDGATIGGQVINTGIGGGGNRVDSLLNRSTRTGYYLRKHTASDVRISQRGGNIDAYHYDGYVRATELFLILAEAQNAVLGADGMLDGSLLSARDVLRQIRQRSRTASFQDDYLAGLTDISDLIKNERRIELCFEGARFWDIRRWNLSLDDVVNGYARNNEGYQMFNVEERKFEEHARYMPINNSEILKFGELKQNRGW